VEQSSGSSGFMGILEGMVWLFVMGHLQTRKTPPNKKKHLQTRKKHQQTRKNTNKQEKTPTNKKNTFRARETPFKQGVSSDQM
jgi:hypothetical protein